MDPATSPADGSLRRVLSATAVMLAVIMVVLDMTIVNVAVPHMMGALGATPSQITWVITSYIVAEAVMIPLSGFLAQRFGRRRVIVVSVAGFVVTSMLCGQSGTLAEMVIFRLLQGAFGASVVPLSQSIMVENFPAESRGKAMAIWGIGIMLGPIMGPTVGGFITDTLDWRWVFYVNIPIGILNLAMILAFIRPSPGSSGVKADWLGAALLAVGVGSLQTMLDRGSQEGWFDSQFIVTLAFCAVLGLILFVIRSRGRPDAILRLDLLRDRNLATSSFMIMALGVGMFSTIVMQPIFLEHLLNYPAGTAGLVMAPRGIAVAVGMMLVAVLITRVAPRRLVLAGLLLASAGCYMTTWYTLEIDKFWIIGPGIVQGIGMGMIFVPLSSLAYQTVPRSDIDRAVSLYNLARTIGGSTGIALSATILSAGSQASWNALSGTINPYNPAFQDWLAATGMSLDNPVTPQILKRTLTQQTTMIGFIDAFYFVTLSFFVLIPLVLLLKKTPPGKMEIPAG